LHLIQFAVAGAGPLSTSRCADSDQRADRRGPVGKWPVAALAVSLLAHVAGVMLLLPHRAAPLTVPLESSLQLVFESPVSPLDTSPAPTEPSIAEDAPLMPPSQPSALPDSEVIANSPPAPEAQEVAPLISPGEAPAPRVPVAPQTLAVPETPAVPVPTPPARPSHAAHSSHHAAPLPAQTRPTPPGQTHQTPPGQVGASQAVATTALFIPPSPVAGMETNRAPIYPPSSLRRGEQGDVMLDVSVSADGTALAVNLAITSGHPSLDAAAEAAVRLWRFIPATRGGRPVAAVADVPVRFRLGN
jgi:protein TonB